MVAWRRGLHHGASTHLPVLLGLHSLRASKLWIHGTNGGSTFPRLWWGRETPKCLPVLSGSRVVLFFFLEAGLWAEPGAWEQEGCSRSKSQAGNSRRQTFSVFQSSKIERIKQITADVPTCNYQLISSDFFFFFQKGKFQNSSQISRQLWWEAG